MRLRAEQQYSEPSCGARCAITSRLRGLEVRTTPLADNIPSSNPPEWLAELLQRLSIKPDGLGVCIEILYMHIFNNLNPIGPHIRQLDEDPRRQKPIGDAWDDRPLVHFLLTLDVALTPETGWRMLARSPAKAHTIIRTAFALLLAAFCSCAARAADVECPSLAEELREFESTPTSLTAGVLDTKK